MMTYLLKPMAFNRTLALVEGAFTNPAVRSAQKILDTVNRSNRIGLGELVSLFGNWKSCSHKGSISGDK